MWSPRRLVVPLALAATGGLMTGCSATEEPAANGDGPTVKVDVGAGSAIEVPKGKPKVAFFAWNNNAYERTYVNRVREQAKRRGMELRFLNSGGDPRRQFAQIQNALSTKRFNAFLVLPADGKLECKLLSKQAPNAKIVVQVSVLPACNRDLNSADDTGMWEPGTLNMTGAENTVAYKVGWLKQLRKRLGGVREIGVVAGPPLQGNWLSMNKALEDFPEIKSKIVATARTNFTTPEALAETQTMLRAHPGLDLIISMYSDITRGVIKALESQGKRGKVKVVDLGASTYSVGQIKAGNLDFTVPYNPIGNADQAVASLARAFNGEDVARYVDDFRASRLGTVDEPLVIDRSNVDSFEPQY
jgi:ribose transport system substrate-binding protein